MLIIIMEVTKGQQIVEAVIKVAVATKEDNQPSKLKTTEINHQPKETEVESKTMTKIVRRIGVKTDTSTTINNETKKENPHLPW